MRLKCLALVVWAVLGLLALKGVEAQSAAPRQSDGVSASDADYSKGARVYAASCSVCHGATGLGLIEAKSAFPADHRNCRHCHKVSNAPTMNLGRIEMNQHDLFDIGEPPPLRGQDAMAANASPAALRAYIAAAMPRYRPGALTEDEYEAVTEYLLSLNGR